MINQKRVTKTKELKKMLGLKLNALRMEKGKIISVKPRANRPNMLGRFDMDAACFANMLSITPTSKNDENVGVMDNMLAKHAASMSNRPNMLSITPTFSSFLDVGAVSHVKPSQHVGQMLANMLGRFARGFIVIFATVYKKTSITSVFNIIQ